LPFVERKRFVRRKDEERRGWGSYGGYTYSALEHRVRRLAHAVSLPLVVAIAVVFALAALGAFAVVKPYVSVRVDPDVYSLLSERGSAEVYVSSEAPLPIGAERVWRFGGLYVYKAVVRSTGEVEALLNTPGVKSVYAEKKLRPAVVSYSASGYDLSRDVDNEFHEAVGAWTGRGVVVAIVDTGIDYTHPDFFDERNNSVVRLLVSVLYGKGSQPYVIWDFSKNGSVSSLLAFDERYWEEYGEPVFLDANGHGTHVAGIVAGRGWASNGKYKGIAPGASLVIVKAFDKTGSSSIDLCLTALEWVHDNARSLGIRILSLSWGAYFASDGSDPLSLAVDSIVDEGVWVFVAAGNAGNAPNTIAVPGVSRKAVTVGAWDAYYDRLAPFSSLGPTVDGRMKPDFAGAGVMTVAPKSAYAQLPQVPTLGQLGDRYIPMSGTSMSTPCVAGVAANFIEYYERCCGRSPTLQDFVNWMVTNGRRVNVFYKDFITGWGIPLSPR
jgi:subtilisin family serine protease